MSTLIQSPYPIFLDTDGDPLENGYIYIGISGLNPLSNPKQAYWDSGLTIPAANIRTKDGYAACHGTPGRLYVDGEYSILIKDKHGRQVFNALTAVDFFNDPTGISIRRVNTIADLRLLSGPAGFSVQLLGYYAKGDGGAGPVRYWDAMSAEADDGGSIIKPTAIAVLSPGRWKFSTDGEINVRWFGAKGDGVANEIAFFHNAFGTGSRSVYVPNGTYRMDSKMTAPKNTRLRGESRNGVIFDFTHVLPADAIHIDTPAITFSAIPDLLATVYRGNNVIDFAAAHGLGQGDIFCIYNPINFSWSLHRSDYVAGEYCIVSRVLSATSVEIIGSLADTYIPADVDLYKFSEVNTYHFSSFTVKGKTDPAVYHVGLKVNGSFMSTIDDVRIYGVSYAGLVTSFSHKMTITRSWFEDDEDSTLATDYGAIIGNSQWVNIRDCFFSAGRHGLSTGGVAGVGCVNVRYLVVDGCDISTSGDGNSPALGLHGNTEFAIFSNNHISGGALLSGDYLSVIGNIFTGEPYNGPTVLYFAEMRGVNIVVKGNQMDTAVASGTSAGVFIRVLMQELLAGGTINIEGNLFTWDNAAAFVSSRIITFDHSHTMVEDIGISIKGNTCKCATPFAYGVEFKTYNVGGFGAYSEIDSIVIQNNDFSGAGIVITPVAGITTPVVRDLVIKNNYISKGYAGIYIRGYPERVSICGNYVCASGYIAIYVATAPYVVIKNNEILDALMAIASSASTRTGIYVHTAVDVEESGNIVRGRFSGLTYTPLLGTFQVGEVITGTVSGATGTIDLIIGATIQYTPIGLVFGVGETITGFISGATGTTLVVTLTRSYRGSFTAITNLRRGVAIDNDGLADYTNTITNAFVDEPPRLYGSAVWDPGSIAAGASEGIDITITGAALGDIVIASFSLNLAGLIISGYVSAADTVRVVLANNTAGAVDLASGTVQAKIVEI